MLLKMRCGTHPCEAAPILKRSVRLLVGVDALSRDNSVGNRGLEHHTLGLEAGQVHELARLQHR